MTCFNEAYCNRNGTLGGSVESQSLKFLHYNLKCLFFFFWHDFWGNCMNLLTGKFHSLTHSLILQKDITGIFLPAQSRQKCVITLQMWITCNKSCGNPLLHTDNMIFIKIKMHYLYTDWSSYIYRLSHTVHTANFVPIHI